MIIVFQLYILYNFQQKEMPKLLYQSISFYINHLFFQLDQVIQYALYFQCVQFLRDHQ